MKIKIISALLLIAGFSSLPAKAASEFVTGRVKRIFPAGTYASFNLDAGCKAGSNVYWKFDISTSEGKAWFAMLLSAATNGTSIRIAYPGPCSTTDAQIISYMYQDF